MELINQTKKTPGDPLRDSLAGALCESREASQAVGRQRDLIERLRNQVHGELPRAVEKAEAGIQRAQRAYASALAKAAIDAEKAAPASGVKAARQVLQDAQDELEAQRAALSQLEDDLATWTHDAREKEIAVEAAISAILARELQAIAKRAEEMLAPFWPLRRVLRGAVLVSEMERSSTLDSLAFQRGRQQFCEAALTANNAILKPLTSRNGEASPEYFGVARQLLRVNPYAELPDAAGGANSTDAVDAA